MHRCLIDPKEWTSGCFLPAPEDVHHLLNVLRIQPGDRIEVFDGEGRTGIALVEAVSPGLVLQLLEENKVANPGVVFHLFQAIPKGQRMDWIIEKATEMGVRRLYPVISERVILRLDARQRVARRERWQRVAENAARQCGTTWMPQIHPILDFGGILPLLPSLDAVLVGSLQADARPLHEVIGSLKTKGLHKVGLLIGPEGDLTPDELRGALDAGALPATFGSLVMRVETAAIFGVSILAYEFNMSAPPAG